jgi:ABC-type transport system involved in multi-copper enzyme maturation permease subunit
MRFGTGPVFAYERVAGARRWHLYAGRSLLVAGLLAAMGMIAASRESSTGRMSPQDYAKLGESYFIALISVELAIVMLAAPAATAGAICLDRARGNLAHMLVTDLSDSEIVLGKLAARLLPVLGLVACSWPIMAIGSLLGGIDPTALTLAFAVILVMAVLGCTLALAFSVWARKTLEVLMATYTVLGLVLLAYPVWQGLARSRAISNPPAWLLHANPVYLAFVPYWAPDTVTWFEYACFFGSCLGLSAVLALLAVWRMRPATLREVSRGTKSPRIGLIGRVVRSLPAPSIEDNPVLWREWHRTRPSPWMLLLVLLVLGTTTVCSIVGAVTMLIHGVDPESGGLLGFVGVYGYMLQVIFGLLMFSAIAPTALAEERQRGSLDVLMTTPLSTRSIVMGKWWGTYRLIPLIAIGPAIMAVAMAYGPSRRVRGSFGMDPLTGPQTFYGVTLMVTTLLAHGALLTSLGLFLATWIRRSSRAMAMSVTAYVLVAIAWPILYFSVIGGQAGRNSFAPVLSPIYVAGSLADLLALNIRFGGFLTSATVWDVLVFLAAMGLLELTVRTFDRCLGRMPERSSPGAAGSKKDRPVEDAVFIAEWESG